MSKIRRDLKSASSTSRRLQIVTVWPSINKKVYVSIKKLDWMEFETTVLRLQNSLRPTLVPGSTCFIFFSLPRQSRMPVARYCDMTESKLTVIGRRRMKKRYWVHWVPGSKRISERKEKTYHYFVLLERTTVQEDGHKRAYANAPVLASP